MHCQKGLVTLSRRSLLKVRWFSFAGPLPIPREDAGEARAAHLRGHAALSQGSLRPYDGLTLMKACRIVGVNMTVGHSQIPNF